MSLYTYICYYLTVYTCLQIKAAKLLPNSFTALVLVVAAALKQISLQVNYLFVGLSCASCNVWKKLRKF